MFQIFDTKIIFWTFRPLQLMEDDKAVNHLRDIVNLLVCKSNVNVSISNVYL